MNEAPLLRGESSVEMSSCICLLRAEARRRCSYLSLRVVSTSVSLWLALASTAAPAFLGRALEGGPSCCALPATLADEGSATCLRRDGGALTLAPDPCAQCKRLHPMETGATLIVPTGTVDPSRGQFLTSLLGMDGLLVTLPSVGSRINWEGVGRAAKGSDGRVSGTARPCTGTPLNVGLADATARGSVHPAPHSHVGTALGARKPRAPRGSSRTMAGGPRAQRHQPQRRGDAAGRGFAQTTYSARARSAPRGVVARCAAASPERSKRGREGASERARRGPQQRGRPEGREEGTGR
eukprot:scaffold4314_cov388-Prasinococcus_capsulatus_cf.AAC.1